MKTVNQQVVPHKKQLNFKPFSSTLTPRCTEVIDLNASFNFIDNV